MLQPRYDKDCMQLYENLIELLADARSRDRHIRFIDGDKMSPCVTFAELWDRALALLGALQARGMQGGRRTRHI